MASRKYNCIEALVNAGVSYSDATALRRISMTLSRWHELECGDSNNYASVCLVRGKKTADGFEYDDNGKPFIESHPYHENKTRYIPYPDREKGAKKRLDAIMARYPGWQTYIQGDPRGCALYILQPGHLETIDGRGLDIESNYTRGIAVCK